MIPVRATRAAGSAGDRNSTTGPGQLPASGRFHVTAG
jgi:hypothetical protein